MSKIPIKHVSKKIAQSKGFDERGCYGCPCKDACCRYGCDVDKESYALMLKNKALIEPLIGEKLEECFVDSWTGDAEFLGGDSIRSKVGKTGFCIFHVLKGKGCVLYEIFQKYGINKRIIPSICRVFPVTWDTGKLCFYDELPGIKIPKTCNVKDPKNVTKKTLAETQKEEVDDIFSF